jgi:hypothetical protein
VIATLLGQLRLEPSSARARSGPSPPQTARSRSAGTLPHRRVGRDRAEAAFVWSWRTRAADEQGPQRDGVQATGGAPRDRGARRGAVPPRPARRASSAGLLAAASPRPTPTCSASRRAITIVLLLRDEALAAQPLPPTALMSAVNVSSRATCRSITAARSGASPTGSRGFTARVGEDEAVLRGPDQEVDRRVRRARAIARVDGQVVPAGDPPAAPLEDPGYGTSGRGRRHVVTLGTLDLPDGGSPSATRLPSRPRRRPRRSPGAVAVGDAHGRGSPSSRTPPAASACRTAYLFVREATPSSGAAGAVMVDSGVVCFAAPARSSGSPPARRGARPARGGPARDDRADVGARRARGPPGVLGRVRRRRARGCSGATTRRGASSASPSTCLPSGTSPSQRAPPLPRRLARPRPAARVPRRGLLGTTRAPENAILVPPATNRELAALERRVVRGLLGEQRSRSPSSRSSPATRTSHP